MRIAQYQNKYISKYFRYFVFLCLSLILLLIPAETSARRGEQQNTVEVAVVGEVIDSQGVPIVDAEIKAFTSQQEEPLAENIIFHPRMSPSHSIKDFSFLKSWQDPRRS